MTKKNELHGYSKVLFVHNDGCDVNTFEKEKDAYSSAEEDLCDDEEFIAEYRLVRVGKIKTVRPAITWTQVK